jgi:hypothetical protein
MLKFVASLKIMIEQFGGHGEHREKEELQERAGKEWLVRK